MIKQFSQDMSSPWNQLIFSRKTSKKLYTHHTVAWMKYIWGLFFLTVKRFLRVSILYPGISSLGCLTDLLHPIQQIFMSVSCNIQWPPWDRCHTNGEHKHPAILPLRADSYVKMSKEQKHGRLSLDLHNHQHVHDEQMTKIRISAKKMSQ